MAREHATAPVAGAAAALEVRPLSAHIGAEIGGVELDRPLSPDAVRRIREVLLRWKVVFFRDQHLDHRQHVAFARQFGAPTPGHVVFGGDGAHPEIYSVAKVRTANRHHGERVMRPWTGWHTDITAAVNPPFASILRGDVVPPYGGDTQWTSLVAAYAGLSETMRGFVDGLRAVHAYGPMGAVQTTRAYEDRVNSTRLVSEHPLVTVHPETGERALFVSPSFVKSVVGLSPRESEHLLELLWEHVVRSEYTVRFKWEPGSIAFWDNRSTAHLAPNDIFATDFDRQFYRVTLNGEVPAGVDGTRSSAVEGEPIAAVETADGATR